MLSAAALYELFEVSLELGTFRWRAPSSPFSRVAIGSEAGSRKADGYWQIKIAGKVYQAHRLIWLAATGEWPVADLDHINGCRTDNRLVNLREATASQNSRNTRKSRSSRTGVSGVFEAGRKYRARVNGVDLGTFYNVDAASAAVKDYRAASGYTERHGT